LHILVVRFRSAVLPDTILRDPGVRYNWLDTHKFAKHELLVNGGLAAIAGPIGMLALGAALFWVVRGFSK
jgi:hypothetical protein